MVEIRIPINKTECLNIARRELSKIGKRAKDAKGANIFSEITPSTAEEISMSAAFDASIQLLKTFLEEYISTHGFVPEDEDFEPPSAYVTGLDVDNGTNEGDLILHIMVNSCFNTTFIPTLQKTIPYYLAYSVLADWWGGVDAGQAQNCIAATQSHLIGIKKCFNKLPPIYPKSPYTRHVRVLGRHVVMNVGEECTLTYEIDYEAKDDICAITSILGLPLMRIRKGKKGFIIKAVHAGEASVKIYSQHDESVFTKVKVIIK